MRVCNQPLCFNGFYLVFFIFILLHLFFLLKADIYFYLLHSLLKGRQLDALYENFTSYC